MILLVLADKDVENLKGVRVYSVQCTVFCFLTRKDPMQIERDMANLSF